MKFKEILLCVLCSLQIISCSQQESGLHDVQGHSVSAKELQGKWVIIHYWATWCDSCRQEIPALNYFYQHHHNKNMVMYGVNYDHLPVTKLKEAIQQVGIQFPVLVEDPHDVWPLGETNVIPITFIVDPDGKLAKTIIGQSTERSLFNTIYSLQQ